MTQTQTASNEATKTPPLRQQLPKDDHKADRQVAFDLMKGKLRIPRKDVQSGLRRRGGKPTDPRSQQAWQHIVSDPYGMSLQQTAQAFHISTGPISEMRRVLRQFRVAGVEPSGEWSTDRRGPDVSAQASPEAVLQALLDIARECAEDLRTIRIEAERLETKAQQARQAACFFAQAQGLAFDGSDFTA